MLLFAFTHGAHLAGVAQPGGASVTTRQYSSQARVGFLPNTKLVNSHDLWAVARCDQGASLCWRKI